MTVSESQREMREACLAGPACPLHDVDVMTPLHSLHRDDADPGEVPSPSPSRGSCRRVH